MVLLGVVLVVVGTRTGSRKRSKNRRDRSPSNDGARQDSWPTPGRTTVTMRRKVEPWRPKGRAQASTQKSAEPPQNPESPLSPASTIGAATTPEQAAPETRMDQEPAPSQAPSAVMEPAETEPAETEPAEREPAAAADEATPALPTVPAEPDRLDSVGQPDGAEVPSEAEVSNGAELLNGAELSNGAELPDGPELTDTPELTDISDPQTPAYETELPEAWASLTTPAVFSGSSAVYTPTSVYRSGFSLTADSADPPEDQDPQEGQWGQEGQDEQAPQGGQDEQGPRGGNRTLRAVRTIGVRGRPQGTSRRPPPEDDRGARALGDARRQDRTRAMIPQTSSAIASRPSTIGITRPMTRAMRVPPTPTSPIATSPAPAQVMVTS